MAGDIDFGRATLGLLLERESVPALLDRALALVVRASGAREAYVEITTDDGGVEASHVVTVGCSEDRVEEIKSLVSRGIVAEAMATGQTVETANAQLDPRFDRRESVQHRGVEAVLCVPIGREQPLGVFYVQGRAAEDAGVFPPTARSDLELLGQTLAIAIERSTGATAPLRSRIQHDPGDPFASVIGRSQAMVEVVERLRFAAPLDVHILFTGPSGSGKTQLAHATHAASKRRAGPFVEINCAALPETLLENELFGAEAGAHSAVPRGGVRGKVELAEGGTLFLDEIGELPLLAQAKILQLLQSKTYYRLGGSTARKADVRFLAATNTQLERAIREKRFREDLYYRLKILEVKVPSLAERVDDVVLLAHHFLRLVVERHDLVPKVLGPAAVRSIQTTEWSGNVRELAHRIEAAALVAEQRGASRVEPADLFGESPSPRDDAETSRALHTATRAFQRRHVGAILEATGWNMTEAARILDVSRTHLYTIVRGLSLTRSR